MTLRPDGGGMTGDLTGARAYGEPIPDGNTFACATCHALSEPAADGIRRPGHSIGDAANRPTYKNGQLTSFREAVNTCVVEWMSAEPLAADSERWQVLEAYLQAEAGEAAAPALEFEIVQPPADVSGGDARRGETLFDGSCAICHAPGGTGTERAPGLVGADTLTPEFIARRIRTSGSTESTVYTGLTDGRMPFWAADRVSDPELLDLVAFVVEISQETPTEADAGPPAADAGPPPDTCTSTHSRVGHVAVLTERFHDVGGTARVVDDCTIVIEDFTYDATGIDAQVYAALGDDFGAGFSISEDLIRPTPYDGETLTLRLPEGRTLDDLDSLSIWCVPAEVDFGSGMFGPP